MFVSSTQAARLLGVTRRTIRKYVEEGVFTEVHYKGIRRIVRIPLDHVREVAAERGIYFDEGYAAQLQEK